MQSIIHSEYSLALCNPSSPKYLVPPGPLICYLTSISWTPALFRLVSRERIKDSEEVSLLTHLKLFFISRNLAITATGSVSPVCF